MTDTIAATRVEADADALITASATATLGTVASGTFADEVDGCSAVASSGTIAATRVEPDTNDLTSCSGTIEANCIGVLAATGEPTIGSGTAASGTVATCSPVDEATSGTGSGSEAASASGDIEDEADDASGEATEACSGTLTAADEVDTCSGQGTCRIDVGIIRSWVYEDKIDHGTGGDRLDSWVLSDKLDAYWEHDEMPIYEQTRRVFYLEPFVCPTTKDGAHTAANAASLVVTLTSPAGVVTHPVVTNTSTGHYYASAFFDEVGTWKWTAVAGDETSAAPQASTRGDVVVLSLTAQGEQNGTTQSGASYQPRRRNRRPLRHLPSV